MKTVRLSTGDSAKRRGIKPMPAQSTAASPIQHIWHTHGLVSRRMREPKRFWAGEVVSAILCLMFILTFMTASKAVRAQLPDPGLTSCNSASRLVSRITQDSIDSSPFVINWPGIYCIDQDIVFRAPSDGRPHAAIVVKANNVSLFFANHTLSDKTSGGMNTAIEVLPGYHSVRIYGPGNIDNFQAGINAGGDRVLLDTPATRGLHVNSLAFEGNRRCERAISVVDVIDGAVNSNRIRGCTFGITASGRNRGTRLQDNEIYEGEFQVSYQFGIYASGTSGLIISGNRIVGDDSAPLDRQQIGIQLWHGGAYASRGRNNVVENNHLANVDNAIVLSGSGQGNNNIVRFNRINAERSPLPPAYQRSTYQRRNNTSALSISRENAAFVHDNTIVTSQNRVWHFGVWLSEVSFGRGSPEDGAAFYNNRTCGVQEDLFARNVSPPSFDQGNQWGFCAAVP